MNSFKLLDCTLREAPIEGLMWGTRSINKVIRSLEKAGIETIEIGFLKDEPYIQGSTSFNRVEEIAEYTKSKATDVMYVALVDYGRYDLSKLSDYDGKSIDAIRVCFKHDEIEGVLEYANQIREKGYQVCIQHVDTMGYSDNEICSFIEKVNEFRPFSYSIVDTFGAMYTSDMKHYVELVTNYLNEEIWLGLHAHNNLMLADSNAQNFVDMMCSKRNIIVDSSLYGCGRSAGNVHTELMTLFMNKRYGTSYDINEVLDLIDTVVASARKKTNWGYSIPYLVSGMYNAHTFNVNYLMKRHNLRSKDLCAIMSMLDETKKKAYDFSHLEELYIKYFYNQIDDRKIIEELTKVYESRKVLLIGPGPSVKENKKELQEFILKETPVVIGVNNYIEGFDLNYVFFSSSVRYHDSQFCEQTESLLVKKIITSNIKTDADLGEYVVSYNSLIKTGWVNIDSSIILLLRLMIRCGVHSLYCAGLDGYKGYGSDFYSMDLDTNLDEQTRIEHTQDNISMMKDIKSEVNDFNIVFLTDSVYEEVFLDDTRTDI